jgi:hypothetical protein
MREYDGKKMPANQPPVLKIEKGIPLPGIRGIQYPWGEMVVGDSFLVPPGSTETIRHAAYAWTKTHPGFKISFRRIPGGDGFRVWRVA